MTRTPMDSRLSNGKTAIVIGGGIIGLCSAYYLLHSGWKVTIIDQGNLSDNCSSGNAGMIVPSHFVPLAAPGMIAKGIRWMFNSKSPFYVKPSLNPVLLSWGWRFMKSSTVHHVERSAPYLRDLHLLSKQLYTDLATQPGFDFGLENKGILMLYKTAKAGDEEIHTAHQAQKLGLEADVLDSRQVQALEPHTELDVQGAVHYRCDAHVYPNMLITQLIMHLKENGVTIITHTPVIGFSMTETEIQSVRTANEELQADQIIMTGGSWLPQLADKAGLKIPVMPGKGYSFMVENTDHPIQYPSLLLEARVAVTPMNGKVRMGGTMEIAPINDRINRNRVQGIVNSISSYYPDYNVSIPEVKDTWYGFRPCSPDGLPYLGRSNKWSNLLIAGGHGMMGLSLGAASGKIIAELANDAAPSADISIFEPGRFN